MNPPAKKALGRSIGDTVLVGLALLLVKYFGPEPIVTGSAAERDHSIHKAMGDHAKYLRRHLDQLSKALRNWMLLCTLAFLLGLVAVGYIAHRNNYNATPPPVNIPVVMYTKGTSWEKGYLDSAGVNRSYHDGHDLGQINGWMKP